MKDRPPMKLRWAFTLWNAGLSLFSLMGFLRTGQELMSVLMIPGGFHKSICSRLGKNKNIWKTNIKILSLNYKLFSLFPELDWILQVNIRHYHTIFFIAKANYYNLFGNIIMQLHFIRSPLLYPNIWSFSTQFSLYFANSH